MVEQDNNQEYGRPRRPNPETISYLRGLPLDENLAAQQARTYVEYFQSHNDDTNADAESSPPEYPPLLSATHAALSSIHHELASLSCDEHSSSQIETLVRIACRYSSIAKRVVLASMASYWVFLSSHRFGSHVAQTVLRCVVAECEVDLDVFDDGQGEGKWEGGMVVDDSYGSLLQGDGGESDELESNSLASHSLSKLLLQSLEELKPFASELTVHVCGTHVLRTALCILAGVEFVNAFPMGGQNNSMTEWDSGALALTRRGKFKDKKKKKKKPINTSEENSSRQEVTEMKVLKMVSELQSKQFQKDKDVLLMEMVQDISSSEGEQKDVKPGELQERTCHPSAGPLLVQMLRLLSYRDYHLQQEQKHSPKKKSSSVDDVVVADRKLGVLPREPRYSPGSEAEALVHRLLCWDSTIEFDSTENEKDGDDKTDDKQGKQPYAGDIIFGLSGEPRGSILLETIFHCCPDSFHDALCKVGGFYEEATMREYISHGVSNFVVQALLVSSRTRNQVARLVKCLCGIVEDGSILKMKRVGDSAVADGNGNENNNNIQRMGIIWRAFEMCATKGSSQDQEQLIHALMRGYSSNSTSSDDTKAGSEENDGSKRKKRNKAKGLSVEDCIPHLLGLTPGSCNDEDEHSASDRLTVDAAGARALYHIFHFTERLRSEWVKGFMRVYECGDMIKIANDGLGSRCIMDALLDGPARSSASKLLLPKISGRISFLAAERVGHHVILKLFRALPREDQASLSADLSQSLNRLGSNAMGRSVMVSCIVKEYLEGESVWKEALAKQTQNDDWLKEILGEEDDDKGDGEGKKRKRKKDKKDAEDDLLGDEVKSKKKKRKSKEKKY